MSGPPPAIRIVVADDHQVVRTGFAELLGTQPDFAVLGTACDGAEAVRSTAKSGWVPSSSANPVRTT